MTAVQVCAKLGGIPWQVESKFGLDPKGTMVIGIDFHYSMGMQERCILMGLVATMDITTMECWLRLKYRVDVSKIVYAGGPMLYAAAELPQTEYKWTMRNGTTGVVQFAPAAPLSWDAITPAHVHIFGNVYQPAMRTLLNMCGIGCTTYDLTPNLDFEWNNPRYGKLKPIPGAAAKLVSTRRGPMSNTDISFRVKHEESVYEMMQHWKCWDQTRVRRSQPVSVSRLMH